MVANISGHCPILRQRGGAMLVMLVILVMGITTVFVTSLSGTAIQNRRNHSSAEALAKAKETLIGYAVTYGDTNPAKSHGFLPCPDSDGSAGANPEGSSESCGTTNVNKLGRLPWRTLDLPALFDGASECLWYAVSGNYKNTQDPSPAMNWDSLGQLHVYDSTNIEISPGEIVAVVIAPGVNHTNADRSGSAAPTCGGNYIASAYLDDDTVHNINNAVISQAKFILPHEDSSTVSTNDQIVFITRQDIWNAIQMRIAKETKKCLDDYAAMPVPSNGNAVAWKYPWAVPVTDITTYAATPNTYFGRLPVVPNSSGGSNDTNVDSMLNLLADLQAALDAYNAGTGSSSALEAAGAALESQGKLVRDSQPTTPTVDSSITTPAIRAGDKAKDGNFSSVQGYIDSTNTALSSAGISLGTGDDTMSTSWPTTCTLFTSSSWAHWRDLVFYQVAKGYQPNSSTDCATGGTCLTINGSGNTSAGNGTYRAAVIVAGKKLGSQTRSAAGATPPNDYLANSTSEILGTANNAHDSSSTTPSTTFTTYKPSDAEHQSVNDLVLCLDGKNNLGISYNCQ